MGFRLYKSAKASLLKGLWVFDLWLRLGDVQGLQEIRVADCG